MFRASSQWGGSTVAAHARDVLREDAGCDRREAGVRCIKRREGSGKVTGTLALRLCRGVGQTYHVLSAAEKWFLIFAQVADLNVENENGGGRTRCEMRDARSEERKLETEGERALSCSYSKRQRSRRLSPVTAWAARQRLQTLMVGIINN